MECRQQRIRSRPRPDEVHVTGSMPAAADVTGFVLGVTGFVLALADVPGPADVTGFVPAAVDV